jgi:hypothetical protein
LKVSVFLLIRLESTLTIVSRPGPVDAETGEDDPGPG